MSLIPDNHICPDCGGYELCGIGKGLSSGCRCGEQPVAVGCVGKAQYRSKGDALACLRRRMKRGNTADNGRGGLRPYRCDGCHAWHLGSSSFRPQERRK